MKKHTVVDPQTLSIVVPVFNEAGNIESLHHEVVAVLELLPYEFELLFIDDGSTDESAVIIEHLRQEDGRVRLLQFSRNFGKEAATTAGIAHAAGDAVLIMDADLQHPPRVIPEFVRAWESGAEVVVGVRKPRAGERFVRRLGSRLFAFVMNEISDVHAPAGSTDFRLIDKQVIEAFRALTEHGRLTRSLIDWLGFKRTFVYFDADERHSGEAHYGYRQLLRTAFSAIIAHSRVPLSLAGYLGVFITCFAAALGFFVMIEQMMLGDPLGIAVSGTAMIAIIIMFLNGIVLIGLGLVSAYIGTIHAEVTGRPLYVIRAPVTPRDIGNRDDRGDRNTGA